MIGFTVKKGYHFPLKRAINKWRYYAANSKLKISMKKIGFCSGKFNLHALGYFIE